jgi:hypothetical protein
MKIERTTNAATQINATADAMHVDVAKQQKLLYMLSDKLYANKFKSIIRELASNARDSHDEAGVTEPFVITAPTYSAPELSVEDFGTGLDYETAKKTILLFLGSTKDYDDEATGRLASQSVGGFGIGSKSPRAYTPDYQMTLRKDGVEYVVVISNDENGMPQSTLLAEIPTDKPNGVKVTVPVKVADINIWQQEVTQYIKFTNYNCVAVVGAERLLPSKPDVSVEFENFTLQGYKHKEWRGTNGIAVQYGGVVYSLDSSNIGAGTYDLCQKLRYDMVFFIRVEGADKLDFSLSRESIEATEKSINFVQEAFKEIKHEATLTLKAAGTTSYSGRIRRCYSYAEVQEVLLAQKPALEQRTATKLAEIAAWNLEDAVLNVQGVYLDRRKSLKTDGAVTFSHRNPSEVTVLWSNCPIDRDTLRELAEPAKSSYQVLIKCSEKTPEKVAAWMEKNHQGLPYKTWFYEQTPVKREPRDIKYVVCAATGNRHDAASGYFRAIPSAEFMWVSTVTKPYTLFVPTAAALKRGLPSTVLSVTAEQVLNDRSVLSWAEGIATAEEAQEVLLETRSYILSRKEQILDKDLFDSTISMLECALDVAYTGIERYRSVKRAERAYGAVQNLPACAYEELRFHYNGSEYKTSDAVALAQRLIQQIVRQGDVVSLLNADKFVQRLKSGDATAAKIAKLLKLELV